MTAPNYLGSPRATEITEERWQIALEWLGSLDRPRAGEFLALWLQYQERFVELCEVREPVPPILAVADIERADVMIAKAMLGGGR